MSLLLMRQRWLSNIQIQKMGAGRAHQAAQPPPACNLDRCQDANSLIRMDPGMNLWDLLQELFPFSEDEASLW